MNNANPMLSEREMKNVNEGARDILRLHVLMCVEIPVAVLNIEEFLHFLFFIYLYRVQIFWFVCSHHVVVVLADSTID